MEKGKKEIKEIKGISKIKLNVNFINFVEKVIKEKLLVKRKEELKVMYINCVKLKSSNNILRVSERVKREKLRSVLEKVLKEKGIEFKVFDKISNELVSKIREKKVGNYLEV